MSFITEIKTKINIVDYIRNDGVDLKTSGVDRYVAKCPFHVEKTPSFSVSETYQNFKCWGCDKSGDVIAYVAERSLLSYYEAAKSLAEKYGIPINNNSNDEDDYKKIKRQYKLLELLESIYKTEFAKLKNNHPAKQQILKRKLEFTEDFGYSPDLNTIMSELEKEKFTTDDLKELGIISSNNAYIFNNRLMFFIRNYLGKTIGFSARSLEENPSGWKYINSSQSKIFNKSIALYNIDSAKTSANKKKFMLIVEGQFDVIALKQRGYGNVVAVSGSAITERQLKEIDRAISDNGKIVLVMDGDSAGIKAMKKMMVNYPNLHSRLYVINLPDGKDPCDYLQTHKRLPKADSLLNFFYNIEKSKFDLTRPEQRIEFLDSLQREVTQYIELPSIKEHYLRLASANTGISYENIPKLSKEKPKQYKKEQTQNPINIAEEDNYYLSALAIFISNRKHIQEINIEDYPQKYHKFIHELNEDKNTHFIPEKYKKKKLAEYIITLDSDSYEDPVEAKSQYNSILQYAKNIEMQTKGVVY